MKRRSSAEAAEEALGVATKKKKQTTKKKGTNPAEAAAARSMAGEVEKAEEEGTKLEEVEEEEDGVALPGGASDVCQALMDRYARSSAPQHRHLCASAAAMRSILLDEDLPLTPPAYFAATIASICDADRGDREALSALSAFLSILLPRVPAGSVPRHKAREAASSLVSLLEDSTPESLSTPTVRSLVGSLGLLAQCVDLDDWSSVKLPFKILLRLSVDGRPKVRSQFFLLPLYCLAARARSTKFSVGSHFSFYF